MTKCIQVWEGKTQCDGCSIDIMNIRVKNRILYHAKVLQNPWGVFCIKCFKKSCIGLGLRLGQKYKWDSKQNKFIGIKGFS